eukprot:3767468-Pyramimonas_sp.AAC.1
MSSYDNVVGGSLKLKGKALSVNTNIKKKNKKKKSKALVQGGGEASGGQEAGDEEAPTPTEPVVDTRTKAEKRFEEQMQALEEKRIREDAKKTHRDRVKEFNEYLSRQSEHHDIPKVGPG